MNHKYVNRLTGKTVYFGPSGKPMFDRSKDAKNFVYMGEISKEEQEKEEQSSVKSKAEILSDAAEKEIRNKELTSETVKAKAKELTQDELDALTKDKQTVIDETAGDEIPEAPEDPEAPETETPKPKSKKKSDEQKEN